MMQNKLHICDYDIGLFIYLYIHTYGNGTWYIDSFEIKSSRVYSMKENK